MSWLFFLKCCKQSVEDPLEHPMNLRIRRDSVVLFDSENEGLIDASCKYPENIIENEVIKGIDCEVIKDTDVKHVVYSLVDSVIDSMEPSMN